MLDLLDEGLDRRVVLQVERARDHGPGAGGTLRLEPLQVRRRAARRVDREPGFVREHRRDALAEAARGARDDGYFTSRCGSRRVRALHHGGDLVALGGGLLGRLGGHCVAFGGCLIRSCSASKI